MQKPGYTPISKKSTKMVWDDTSLHMQHQRNLKWYGTPTATHLFEEEVMEKSILPPYPAAHWNMGSCKQQRAALAVDRRIPNPKVGCYSRRSIKIVCSANQSLSARVFWLLSHCWVVLGRRFPTALGVSLYNAACRVHALGSMQGTRTREHTNKFFVHPV
jgi:hypothetical protein